MEKKNIPRIFSIWKDKTNNIFYMVEGVSINQKSNEIQIMYSNFYNPLSMSLSDSLSDWNKKVEEEESLEFIRDI